MKNTFLYSILVCLFLLMGKVEVTYGQNVLPSEGTWGKYKDVVKISKNETINLTDDINMYGVILVEKGCTLTITSEKNVTIKNVGIMNPKDMVSNPGRSRFFTIRGNLIIKGEKGATITLDGGADFTWNDYKLEGTDQSRKLTEMIANECEMTLENVHITNVNAADEYQDGYVDKDGKKKRIGNTVGGAIYISSGEQVANGITKLVNCTIDKCYSQLGSAIMIGGHDVAQWPTLTPENCKVEVINSTITQCVSGGGDDSNSGGAIRSYGNTLSNLYLTGVTMSYNYAKRNADYNHQFSKDGNGGALFWNGRQSSETVCIINGCTFEYNKCDDNGGAIKSQSSIKFRGAPTYIQYNQAPNGAGLYIEGYIGGVQLGASRELTYDLNSFLIVRNNTASSYQYGGKNYPGKGAGVHFFFGNDMTLEASSTINVNMNGATIQENGIEGEGGLGGGVYFEDTAPAEKNYTFNINLNYGKLLNNTSTAYGGGMYISEGDVTSETKEGKEMVVTGNTASQDGGGIYIGKGSFTMNTKGMINENEATQGNGGGIYVGGDFTMMSGTISGNEASHGDGGGAYIHGGIFTMHNGAITNNMVTKDGGGVFINGGELIFNDGSISGNDAGLENNGNGGGICLLNGKVEIKAGTISNNESGQHGGGLYVYNSEEDEQGASFTGGNIVQNKAHYGGGVCVNGNINLKIGTVTVDENEAINGGGICLLNGAKMDFGQGFIRENKAAATDTWQGGTAYQKSITEVKGIGGGVYLDSNTSLTFSVVNELGLYDNFADYGADDVFANGEGTMVSYKNGDNVVNGLPVVRTMKLAGFAVAGEPYWVEDYIAGDDGYAYGTVKKLETDDVRRYRTSIQNLKEVYKVESDEDLQGASQKYLCLAIGHDIVYVTVTKKGLAEGESAIFTIELVKDGNVVAGEKRTILLTGNGTDNVSKMVALSTGTWKVTENDWTWAYSSTDTNGKSITQTIANGSRFEFVNVKNTGLPLHDEAKVENSMVGVSSNER